MKKNGTEIDYEHGPRCKPPWLKNYKGGFKMNENFAKGKMGEKEGMMGCMSMMENMMGNDNQGEKRNMMQQMMQNMMEGQGEKTGFNPMEMCRQMQETMSQITKMAGYPSSEVQAMFEEWSMELEKEILNQLKDQSEVDIPKISKNLGISEESTLYFISKLLRDKKVKVTGLKVNENQ